MEGSGGVNGDASAKPEVTVEAGPEPTQPEPVEPRTEPSADGTPTSGTPATTETLAGAAAPETTAVQTPAVDPTAAAPATAAPAVQPAPAAPAYPTAAAPAYPTAVATAHPVGMPRPRRRPSWTGLVALVLVIALGAMVGYQTHRLNQVTDELAQTRQQFEDVTSRQATGLQLMDDRVGALEYAWSTQFNPEEIAKRVIPSVFVVIAGDMGGTAFAFGYLPRGDGTTLITNYHVVEEVWRAGDREVTIERLFFRYKAEIIDVDEEYDLALLLVDRHFTRLQPSYDDIRVGQPVVLVGAPLGLGDSLSTGVISHTERYFEDVPNVEWIQFDAQIQPGNSGGPVINADGEVVGVATMAATKYQGIGFALPVTYVCEAFRVCIPL